MREVFLTGPARDLAWGADGSGRFRAKEYFEAVLDARQRVKFEVYFKMMADTGCIRSTIHFNNEGDGLYAFKIHKHRLTCIFDGREVVLLTGFVKKTDTDKRAAREIKTAKAIRATHLSQKDES